MDCPLEHTLGMTSPEAPEAFAHRAEKEEIGIVEGASRPRMLAPSCCSLPKIESNSGNSRWDDDDPDASASPDFSSCFPNKDTGDYRCGYPLA